MSESPAIMMSVPYDQWQALHNRLRAAQEEIAKLNASNIELQRSDPNDRLPNLIDTVRAALPIVQFCVGNLHPMTVRGWPYEALKLFSSYLAQLPTLTAFEAELALDLRNFGDECERLEMDRKRALQRLQAIDTTKPASAITSADGETVNPITSNESLKDLMPKHNGRNGDNLPPVFSDD